jgi:hypothetical protein
MWPGCAELSAGPLAAQPTMNAEKETTRQDNH